MHKFWIKEAEFSGLCPLEVDQIQEVDYRTKCIVGKSDQNICTNGQVWTGDMAGGQICKNSVKVLIWPSQDC